MVEALLECGHHMGQVTRRETAEESNHRHRRPLQKANKIRGVRALLCTPSYTKNQLYRGGSRPPSPHAFRVCNSAINSCALAMTTPSPAIASADRNVGSVMSIITRRTASTGS